MNTIKVGRDARRAASRDDECSALSGRAAGRPTLELLREIAPDVRVVLNIAEFFGLEALAFDLREQVDAETAEYIANQRPAMRLGGTRCSPNC